MNKNLTRDLQIILKLLTYIKKMQTALQQYGCKTSSQFIANETCMDLCSFYILQISSHADNYQKSPAKLLILSVQET